MKLNTLVFTLIVSLLAASNAVAGGRPHHGHYGGGRHHPHGGGYYPRYRGYYPGYAIGGLVLGGLIGSALTSRQYNTTRYIERYPVYQDTYPGRGNSFLREANGSCFLINYNANGGRVLTPVPEENCQ